MKNKAIMIGVTLVAGVFLVMWGLMFPLASNKEEIRKQLQEAFLASTGMKLEIQGTPELKMSLLPYISVDKLYVSNTPDATAQFLLAVDHMNIWPSFMSLLHGPVTIRKIEMSDVTLEAEVLSGGRLNWQEVSSYWVNGVFQMEKMKNAAVSGAMKVVVRNAHLHYSNILTGGAAAVDGLNLALDIDPAGKADAGITFNYRNRPYAITGHVKDNLLHLFMTDAVPVELSAVSGQNSFSYVGNAGYKNNRTVFNGDVKLNTDDVAYWIELYHGENPEDGDAGYKKLPLSVTTKVVMENPAVMQLKDIAFDGTTLKGHAQANVGLVAAAEPQKGLIANLNTSVNANVKATIDSLNLDDIVENGILVPNKEEHSEQNMVQGTPLPAAHASNPVNVSADINIKDIAYNGKHVRNALVSMNTSGEDLLIPQCIAMLPGDTRLDFSGIGHTSVNGLTFEGQLDAEGKSLVEMLGLFKSNSIMLPAQDFRRFHLRANALVSSKAVMLSELVARVENMLINGGLNVRLEQRTNVQAALGIRGLNIDHIATLWGLQSLSGTLLSKNDLGDQKEGAISVWLKKLGYDVLISTSLEQYVLGSKTYDKANLTIAATAGKIELTGVKVPYEASVLSGKAGVNVLGKIPEFDIHLMVDQLDLNTFFPKQAKSGGTTNARWSNDLLSFGWMDMLKGTYDIKFGHLKYDVIEGDNVGFVGTLADQRMSIDHFTANAFGSGMSGRIIVTGGAIPTLAATGNVLGLRLEALTPLLPVMNGVAGICNLSINLNTNGISPLSWMSNMQGGISVSGRNIEVRGFNLPGIIRAVAYVRTVADIYNVVNRAVPGGNTLFTTLEAQWNISKGVLETLNAKVSNAQADGNIASRLDMINWTSSSAVTFALKALDATKPPKMLVKLTGSMDQPKMDFDTSALEQYVNNKTSERLLHDYGAH